MCLIAFAYKDHHRYDLIFAANRDEFYGRPTKAAAFWKEYPEILAGRDLEAGGTWMGVTKNGSLAAITNYRDPSIRKEDSPSRGHLVLDYLKDPKKPEQYLDEVDQKADMYNGFSIFAGSVGGLMFYSNQQRSKISVKPGIHGLSNHLLDTPWPKVVRAKEQLQNIISEGNFSEEDVFSLLQDETRPADHRLPDTGIPKEIEKQVSPIFIRGEEYGTRSSTLLLIDKSGEVAFTEQRYAPGTKQVEEVNRYRFSINYTDH